MHSFQKTDTTENFLVRWTVKEDNQLLEELQQGLHKKIIALNHKRTIGGIRCRIFKLAYLDYLSGNTKENLCSKFNLSLDDIDKYFNKKQLTYSSK